jgi:hypothetical protein
LKFGRLSRSAQAKEDLIHEKHEHETQPRNGVAPSWRSFAAPFVLFVFSVVEF